MKKGYIIPLIILSLLSSFPVLAEGAEHSAADPFSWEYLCTTSGAAAFTLLLCQFIKAPLDKLWKLPTRLLAYLISLFTMLAATALTAGITPESLLLAVINALISATSAYGMYEITFARKEN